MDTRDQQSTGQELAGPDTGVLPYLTASDANAQADFYVKAFGAEVLNRSPADDGKRLMHCHLRINGGSLMMSDAFPEYGSPFKPPQGITLHLQVRDGQMWWDRAIAAGCKETMKFERQFWGDDYGQLVDPFGFNWSIGSTGR